MNPQHVSPIFEHLSATLGEEPEVEVTLV